VAQNQLRTTLRKVHKWIFIYMGIFMLFWVLSGIMLSIPTHWLDVGARPDTQAADYSVAAVSPSQAAATVFADSGKDASIDSLHLQMIQGKLLYVIKLKEGDLRLIDAGSGKYFPFTPQLAEAIVRERYGIETAVIENRVMNTHDMGYPWGPLPVSHLRFAGEFTDADFYVNHASGNVRSATLLTRARAVAGIIHSLEPIKFVSSERTHRTLLVFAGVVSLFGVLAGLYLVLPRRR
jgi:uncharacterized iron-regulated membrane protein